MVLFGTGVSCGKVWTPGEKNKTSVVVAAAAAVAVVVAIVVAVMGAVAVVGGRVPVVDHKLLWSWSPGFRTLVRSPNGAGGSTYHPSCVRACARACERACVQWWCVGDGSMTSKRLHVSTHEKHG